MLEPLPTVHRSLLLPLMAVVSLSMAAIGPSVGTASAAAEARAAATSPWSTTVPKLPSNGSATAPASLGSVSCESRLECVAVGEFTDTSGHPLGLIEVYQSGQWTALQAPVPADGGPDYGTLKKVACYPTGCTAIGSYYSSTYGGYVGLIVTGTGTAWTAHAAVPPAGHYNGNVETLYGLGCASNGSCAAAGIYEAPEDSDSYQNEGIFVSGSGSAWTTQVAPLPSDAKNQPATYTLSQNESISCPALSSCEALGLYSGGALAYSGWGASWSYTKLGAGLGNVYSLSCSGASSCLGSAINYPKSGLPSPNLIEDAGGSWTADGVPVPVKSGSATSLADVSCVLGGSCSAAGQYSVSGTQPGFIDQETSGIWTSATAPLPSSATGVTSPTLAAIACAAGGSCAAAGQYTDSVGQQAWLLNGSGASWESTAPPGPASASANPAVAVKSVACATGICIAVGSFSSSAVKGGVTLPVIYTYTPGPIVDSISLRQLPVNDSAAMTIDGSGFKGATTVSWRCLNNAGGFGIGSANFSVNSAGTEITVPATPAPVDAAIASYASKCGYTTDQAAYAYDITVTAGGLRSPAVSADRFDYLGPRITVLAPASSDIDVTTPIRVVGKYLKHVNSLHWRCGAARHGLVYSGAALKVDNSGGEIDMTSPDSVDKSIAGIAAPCGWQTDQAEYGFQVRAGIGSLLSPPVAADSFTYNGPEIASLSMSAVAVGVSDPFTVRGSGLEAATQVQWACVGRTNGLYYGPDAFSVNKAGTTLTSQTPPGVQSWIGKYAASCFTDISLDQFSYPFEVRIRVGQLFSPRTSADAFKFDAPVVLGLNLHSLKIGAVVPLTVQGANFQEATAIAWNCAAGPHGFHIGVHTPGVSINSSGSQIQMKTNPKVGVAIAAASKACGFTSGQTSYRFDIRVEVGPLYSPRSSGDVFVYHK